MDVDKAWLAGLIDGEGSIGITSCNTKTKAGRPTGRVLLTAMVQLSMTCKKTVDHATKLMIGLGVSAIGYSFREKDPTKHLDAHYIRVNRLADINKLAELLLPYAVTKEPQWRVILEFTRLRLLAVKLDESGRVIRGQAGIKAYSARELQLAEIAHDLNARGPGAKAKKEEWLRKLAKVPVIA